MIDGLKSAYRKEYERNPVLTLFLTILIVFFIIFVIAAILTNGNTVKLMFVYDPNDTFMDYFNSIMYSSDRPYTYWLVVYPPLITVMYAVIGRFMIPFVDVLPGEKLSFALRYTQMGMMSFFLISILTFFLLHWIFRKIVKNADWRTELLFLLMMLSFPFMYALERGNSIILTLVFCFMFLLGYKSENKFIRYASYVALGCAAGFKLYPAILFLLILRERRYKEAGICVAIVATLLLMPFIFTDGTPLIYLDTLFTYSGTFVGVTNINQIVTEILQFLLGVSEKVTSIVSNAILGIFTVLSLIVILFDKEMKFWKVLALIGCNLILGFGVGCQYQLVYMAMPILYFLAAEKEMTKENKTYAICFAMMMVLIPGVMIEGDFFTGLITGGIHPSWIIGAFETALVIVVAIMLLREGIGRLYRKRREVRSHRGDPA